ncbi:hypothetical protein MRX96_016566 [Rhipicephalus microplus]
MRSVEGDVFAAPAIVALPLLLSLSSQPGCKLATLFLSGVRGTAFGFNYGHLDLIRDRVNQRKAVPRTGGCKGLGEWSDVAPFSPAGRRRRGVAQRCDCDAGPSDAP